LVKEKIWQPAIDWYENRIENPPSYQDSVFAVIDLGDIHLMMEADSINGAKSGKANYRLEEIKPKSKQAYEENKATLLATLPQKSKSKTDNSILASQLSSPEIYHEDDKEGLRMFLRQPSEYEWEINAERVGLQISDTLNWLTDEGWVAKVVELDWNNDTPKRLIGIGMGSWGWFDKKLSGNLDCSKWIALREIYAMINKIKSLNISNCPALEIINFSSNRLTTLSVYNSPSLRAILVTFNRLTKLDIDSPLAYLDCSGNDLTTLNLNSPNLYYLYCNGNRLTSLKAESKFIDELWCNNNQLRSIEIDFPNRMSDFRCYRNQMLFSAFPNSTSMWQYDYSPQNTIDGGIIYYSTGIDLSKEYVVKGNFTQFSWFDITNEDELLIELAIENGFFLLTEEHIGRRLR
jgi:hypothetical protein